ncbi:MAG: DUF6151 family protein [Arenicellales bacterium]|nr:DUF6151 family protein [Arenicellales bacterium]
MMIDLSIRCSCGSLHGVVRGVSSDRGNLVVCYCDDCQSFAHFLGRAEEILDAHGGTDIFQISPTCVEFKKGADQLACMRLTPKGLLRWYTNCCKTPIANTLPIYQIPFAGLIHSCFDQVSANRTLDTVLGPVRARVHGRFAKGDLTQLNVHPKIPVANLMRVALMLVRARVHGDHKSSPFFDSKTREPRATPRVLTEEELATVRKTIGT